MKLLMSSHALFVGRFGVYEGNFQSSKDFSNSLPTNDKIGYFSPVFCSVRWPVWVNVSDRKQVTELICWPLSLMSLSECTRTSELQRPLGETLVSSLTSTNGGPTSLSDMSKAQS